MSIAYELYKPPGGKKHLNPRSEDILTGNVFGFLKLLTPELWLLSILQRTYGDRDFTQLAYSGFSIEFWKKLHAPLFRREVSEIDVFLEVPPISILTECKYRSRIENTQIIRYLDIAAYHYCSHNCEEVYFLLISKHQSEPPQLTRYRNPREIELRLTKDRPHVDYKRASIALANNIGWISWMDILRMLEDLSHTRLTYSEGKLIEELVRYLKHKLGS